MTDLAALAARHVRNNFGACMDCAPKPWPCDARQIADALAEARKEAQRRRLQWTELVNKTEAEVVALRAALEGVRMPHRQGDLHNYGWNDAVKACLRAFDVALIPVTEEKPDGDVS